MKKFCIDVHKRYEDEGRKRLEKMGVDYELFSFPERKSRFILSTEKNDPKLLTFASQMAVIQGAYWLALKSLATQSEKLSRWQQAEIRPLLKLRIALEEKRLIEAACWDLHHLHFHKPLLDLEGYLYFAAHGLKRCIKLLTAAEIEHYLFQKEEEDFINVLRFMVNIQESMVEEAHIFLREQSFDIKDSAGNDLKKMYAASLESIDDDSINQEDLIMSILITLVPQKIIIHFINAKNDSLLKIAESVFDQRLQICTGCERCQNLSCHDGS